MAKHPVNFFQKLQAICLDAGVKLFYTPNAKKFNTHPAIIVGRLQHLEKMHFSEGREFLEPVNLEVSSSNVAS